MSSEEYKKAFYKRYALEPEFYKAMFICFGQNGTIQTDAGVRIRASRGGGLFIEYERLNGNKIKALVHNEDQYLTSFYRISRLAEYEHPQPVKPKVEEKRTFIENDKDLQ